jgi:hypothetical protein
MNDGKAVETKPPIRQELDKLNIAIDSLEKSLSILRDHLFQVCVPPSVEKGKGTEPEVDLSGVRSKFSLQVMEAHTKVQCLADGVDAILSRIEL